MSYPPTPTGMVPYGHAYYPNYPAYSATGTPTAMQPPYGYPFAPHPGFMQHPHAYGMPAPQSMHAYGMEEAAADDEEAAMEEDEDIDMEMPLDKDSAEKAMKHMIYTQLYQEGFDGARASAVDVLLKEVIGFVQNLYLATQEYGAQAGRSAPGVQDFAAACEEYGITPDMLKPNGKRKLFHPKATKDQSQPKPRKRKRKRRANSEARHANLIPRDLSSPEPELLPAEDVPHVPPTLRAFHNVPFLPSYPPKHTYIRSPPSPPQRSTLSASLDKRMQNTAKVRQALKNLMDAAEKKEEELEANDMNLDGAAKYKLTHSTLVNWQESFTLTRKRWKVGK